MGIFRIESLLDRKPDALSGGRRQCVAVGGAIRRQLRLFPFDEPLSKLKVKMRARICTEITKLHQQLQTMIFMSRTHR